jgi:hypothetical protein
MVVTTSSASKSRSFISRLRKDYPDFKFAPGNQEHWSPHSKTITYKPAKSIQELRYGVLHELAHALLDHSTYHSDFELLKLESDAWELAAKIGRKYHIRISDDHIQNCLDTYRDWLHRRSACPMCGMHVLQADGTSYHCFNCQATWKVSSGRFVRPYRQMENN